MNAQLQKRRILVSEVFTALFYSFALGSFCCLVELYYFHLSCLPTIVSLSLFPVCLKNKLSPRSRLLPHSPINTYFRLYFPSQKTPKDRAGGGDKRKRAVNTERKMRNQLKKKHVFKERKQEQKTE